MTLATEAEASDGKAVESSGLMVTLGPMSAGTQFVKNCRGQDELQANTTGLRHERIYGKAIASTLPIVEDGPQ